MTLPHRRHDLPDVAAPRRRDVPRCIAGTGFGALSVRSGAELFTKLEDAAAAHLELGSQLRVRDVVPRAARTGNRRRDGSRMVHDALVARTSRSASARHSVAHRRGDGRRGLDLGNDAEPIAEPLEPPFSHGRILPDPGNRDQQQIPLRAVASTDQPRPASSERDRKAERRAPAGRVSARGGRDQNYVTMPRSGRGSDRRERSWKIAFVWIWQTRLSVTPSTLPISASVRPS